MLYASADGPRTRFAVTVYAAGLCSMLLVSITYHRWVHLLCARARWRRADHAMIFAAIAGSTTPIALIAAPGPRGLVAIAMVWLMSIIGAGCKVARWERGDVVGSVFYVAVSVTSATLLPSLWHHSGMAPAVLFMASGSVYAGGAICFARGWPRVRPTVFSFHEVWHVMTLIAAGAHFAAVWSIAT